MDAPRPPRDHTPVAEAEVIAVRAGTAISATDHLAVEAPLEIRVRGAAENEERALTVTMRSPGHDEELAVGFLVAERLLENRQDLLRVERTGPETVVVTLARFPEGLADATRASITTSACGVCGKGSIEAVRRAVPSVRLAPSPGALATLLVTRLPAALRKLQDGFAASGGIHAAGLFGFEGDLRLVREDVGRHNAVDKLIGALPADETILMLSGRASFELVQKALVARIPAVAAVGAPSSLAVGLAEEAGLTLLGFVREDRFNCYSGAARLAL